MPVVTENQVFYPREGYAKTKDACKFLNISRTTLFRYMDLGMIPTIRINEISSHRRIPWAGLWQFSEKKVALEKRLEHAGNGCTQFAAPIVQ